MNNDSRRPDEAATITKQEIFDRAYLGLASQGFQRCTVSAKGVELYCAYSSGDGRHCAWGWVDTTLGPEVEGAVSNDIPGLAMMLRALGRGDIIRFGQELQNAHDRPAGFDYDALSGCRPMSVAEAVRGSLEAVARNHGLTVPELPPDSPGRAVEPDERGLGLMTSDNG